MLETRDVASVDDLDPNILREYISSFPGSGLGKLLAVWLTSELSPFPSSDEEAEKEAESVGITTTEARLEAFADGLSMSNTSSFAHRLASAYYLHLEEFKLTVDTARFGLHSCGLEEQRTGINLKNTRIALETTLATALVHHEAPKHHDEADQLFERLLSDNPDSTEAKIGRGLIFIEREAYEDARSYLSAASAQDPSNIHVKIELAWCEALLGNYEAAYKAFDEFIPQIKGDNPKSKDLKALVQYRAGVCLWELDPSKSARKSRSGAYSHFLAAIKSNANFAPAYTSLGTFYGDYAKDRKRARQCYQKAFELSSAETFAAECLARSFAAHGDWDIVEVISQRVVDSGRTRPPPGSKKQGISWPYSALGVVQMNKLEYQQAIVSFLAALRISPDDFQSYVGLGESYHNSGRYNSALRTFTYALEPPEGTALKISGERWFARYMLANVYRELGDYDEATAGLQSVLEERPSEFGVLVSLLQTYIDHATKCIETGLFGQAVECAKDAFTTASTLVEGWPTAFNVWKGIGDAVMIFAVVHSAKEQLPIDTLSRLLQTGSTESTYADLSDIDHVSINDLRELQTDDPKKDAVALTAAILAYKRALKCSTNDIHAQAVAWYNLGWAEQRAHALSAGSGSNSARLHLKAAVRCFRRSIELEAGNAEFWNSLGVVTTTLNPKVAQHSFVRSLHINELNARVWTNLGVLYYLQNDHTLAHQAFGRAQSTDPTYGSAWVGEGLVALLLGDTQEALNHFTHAFEISNSTSVTGQRLYTQASFDNLIAESHANDSLTTLISPLFALQQLRRQTPSDLPHKHLAALLLERIGDHTAAINALEELCEAAEAEYEASESDAALVRFVHAKSDLGRCQLATQNFSEAAANAETVIDLLSDSADLNSKPDVTSKIILSAHLTAGLAYYFLNNLNGALQMFKLALRESENDPDVVCLLVKVLWAQGGEEERDVARNQLFESVEQFPENVALVTLLGAMSALDRDSTAMAAVKDDLWELRTKPGLTTGQATGVEYLITALSTLALGDGVEESPILEAQRATFLRPDQPQPWVDLARESNNEHTALMATNAAQRRVPPAGDLNCSDLANAFAESSSPETAQRAIALAPWEPLGWQALGRILA